jgi:hypothetical protein
VGLNFRLALCFGNGAGDASNFFVGAGATHKFSSKLQAIKRIKADKEHFKTIRQTPPGII